MESQRLQELQMLLEFLDHCKLYLTMRPEPKEFHMQQFLHHMIQLMPLKA
uniref:Uncharacterized protein n=1 Tax=Arundo donax TaxID=35708 RepID=A0A0A9D0T4_ARUDO